MGQQQLLLIILGVIIVGIAISVGLSLFAAQSIQSNKDAMINDMNNLAANAYQFRIRPRSMGGGSGSYASYNIPQRLRSNENGSYVPTPTANEITIVGTSVQNATNTITAVVGSNGKLGSWTYGGDFL
jgi:hypothetical protein